eukprot:3766047-Rhodomonas_salina.5
MQPYPHDERQCEPSNRMIEAVLPWHSAGRSARAACGRLPSAFRSAVPAPNHTSALCAPLHPDSSALWHNRPGRIALGNTRAAMWRVSVVAKAVQLQSHSTSSVVECCLNLASSSSLPSPHRAAISPRPTQQPKSNRISEPILREALS